MSYHRETFKLGIKQAICVILSFALLGSLSLQTGCSCRPKPATSPEDKKKDPLAAKDKPKPDFEAKRILLSPSDIDLPQQGIKPGHWYNASQHFKANNFDFLKGEVESFTSRPGGRPFLIEGTNFHLRLIRPAALPKGQGKNLEQTYFAPTSTGRPRISLNCNLRHAGGSVRFPSSADATARMEPHQYYLALLASNPERYTYAKTLETIKPPTAAMQSVPQADYRFTVPDTKDRVDLPSNPLAWSSISHLLWDDFDPTKLTRDQQRAIVDWVHWGGQLIVSGPDSLDNLRASFLGKLLPAMPGKIKPIPEESIAQLNGYWSHQGLAAKLNAQTDLAIDPSAPLEMIELIPQEEGDFIPQTGQLVTERRIGRGRIVLSAFRLSAREFGNWRGCDNFFNNALFRRAPRIFKEDVEGISFDWRQTGMPPRVRNELAHDGTHSERTPNESMLTTKVRYFSRDATLASNSDGGNPRDLHLDVNGYTADKQSGIGGWNDGSSCAITVNESLTESGGIEVPDASFILKALGGYLLVLVPLNWIVFRLMGRVEWAWFAVPVIAIMGTYFVVRLAQLDIGFARSRTELNIIETQPDHQRAHLSRFTSLYTSLSTSYEFGFSDKTAVALPFGSRNHAEKAAKTVTLRLGGGKTGEGESATRTRVRMQGFAVDSNNSGMVHSEQMFELGGKLSIEESSSGFQVINNTDYVIHDAAVVARIDGSIQTAWVGELPVQQKKSIQFEPFGDGIVDLPEWDESEATNDQAVDGRLRMRTLLQMAVSRNRLNDGDIRMTGWSDQEIPGLVVYPRASQATYHTVIVSNLRYGKLPPPASDVNTTHLAEIQYKKELGLTNDRTN
ncbi:hypothetical protein ACFL2H_08895 [Planctomycetota bacterium]